MKNKGNKAINLFGEAIYQLFEMNRKVKSRTFKTTTDIMASLVEGQIWSAKEQERSRLTLASSQERNQSQFRCGVNLVQDGIQ